MSDPLLIAAFLLAAAVSLGTSWVLVSRLERVGARFGLPEALLGLVAALAADAPEITSAITALIGHRTGIGSGVVLGSNVFNLAALLGLTSVTAGRIPLHRRVIALEAAVALPVSAVAVAVVPRTLPASAGLGVVGAVLIAYVLLLGLGPSRLERWPLPEGLGRWLARAVHEEELELGPAVHVQRGQARDVIVAVVGAAVVVGASVAMEQAASELGSRHGIPQTVTGAVILAGVTSLPNAVAGIYLARRGRSTATLSTAMNSNALNVAVGLLLPGTILGLSVTPPGAVLVAGWYVGLTAFTLAGAYLARGLRRGHGLAILSSYVAFVALVVGTT